MSAARVTHQWTTAVRRGLAESVAVVGIVAIGIGVVYVFWPAALPHLMQRGPYVGHHVKRGAAGIGGGAVCVIAAWLIGLRPRPAASASPAEVDPGDEDVA